LHFAQKEYITKTYGANDKHLLESEIVIMFPFVMISKKE